MPIIQVRDVPDDVAEVIAEKARAEHKSVSSYLRDLMAADAQRELRRRAMKTWLAEVRESQRRLGVSKGEAGSGAAIVRELRDEYNQGKL